jgi:hypothetical protein
MRRRSGTRSVPQWGERADVCVLWMRFGRLFKYGEGSSLLTRLEKATIVRPGDSVSIN